MPVCGCVHRGQVPGKDGGGHGPLGAGVTSSCELWDTGYGELNPGPLHAHNR